MRARASPLICLSGRGRINHCPLLGEEGTVNKVAFGRAWKCRQAPSPLCGNQWASGLRLPQPHQANGAPHPPPSPAVAPASGSLTGAQAPLTGCWAGVLAAGYPPALQPSAVAARGPFCALPGDCSLVHPGDVSLGRSKCGGVGVPRPLSPNPMDTLSPAATHPAQLPLFLVLVTGCSWSSLGGPSPAALWALFWATGWGCSPRPTALHRWWRWSRGVP